MNYDIGVIYRTFLKLRASLCIKRRYKSILYNPSNGLPSSLQALFPESVWPGDQMIIKYGVFK